MAPFKSTLARSVGKLLGVYREADLSLRGATQSIRQPPPPLSATGGLTYIPGNGFKYHVFKSPTSDNFISGGIGTVEVLVVGGGGGGGGAQYSGGGGGGGIIHDTAWSVVNATYPITIGAAGGAGANGGDSYFGPPSTPQGLTGKGGGAGGYYGDPPTDGSAGGSGGGDGSGGPGTAPAGNQPSVTRPNAPTQTNYGYPGGGPATPGAVSSAGGGGAGAAGGVNPGGSLGGQGGNGQPFSGFEYPLIGLSPLNPHSPTNNHYGGGGSGWGYSQLDPASDNGTAGGYGGGGRGSSYPGAAAPDRDGSPGISHLGGGGAGDYGNPTGTPGGSGIIIIRYAV